MNTALRPTCIVAAWLSVPNVCSTGTALNCPIDTNQTVPDTACSRHLQSEDQIFALATPWDKQQAQCVDYD